MHVHLTLGGGYYGYDSLKLTDERRAILGVLHAEQILISGFTTVRNVGAGSFGDVALRDAINDGADFIKTCSNGGVLCGGTQVCAPQYTVKELTALVDEAHSRGLKVASHAHRAEGIVNGLIAGAETIKHASFIADEGIRLAI